MSFYLTYNQIACVHSAEVNHKQQQLLHNMKSKIHIKEESEQNTNQGRGLKESFTGSRVIENCGKY